MGATSKIEWTDATWNPVSGCTKVSPGCKNCYAERVTERWGKTFTVVEEVPERLSIPFRWRRGRRIFTCSMSDLFHAEVSDGFLDRVFAVMLLNPRHTFQVLTKRADRMRAYFSERSRGTKIRDAAAILSLARGDYPLRQIEMRFPIPNVWLGVSVEDQDRAEERIPDLLATPAALRFLSVEPLLGPVALDRWFGLEKGNDWRPCLCAEIDPVDRPCSVCVFRKEYGRESGIGWIIVGGESGPGGRPMHPDWARTVRDLAIASGIPFHFKQWGEWRPRLDHEPLTHAVHRRGMTAEIATFNPFAAGHPYWTSIRRAGKKDAGRVLDGRTWDEFPELK